MNDPEMSWTQIVKSVSLQSEIEEINIERKLSGQLVDDQKDAPFLVLESLDKSLSNDEDLSKKKLKALRKISAASITRFSKKLEVCFRTSSVQLPWGVLWRRLQD